MSPPGRPEGEYRKAQPEGSPVSPPGRPPAASAVPPSAEALRYAAWLAWGTRAGVAVLLGGLVAALAGWLPPQVPPEQVALWWGQPVDAYLHATGASTGWAWIRQLAHGDMAGLLGVALLAASAVPPLLALLPLFARWRDWVYVLLCLAQIGVVVLAASGWPGGRL